MSGPQAAAAPRPPQRQWLAIALAVTLALALAAVAWLQLRQQRLLDATVRFQDEYLQVSLAQVQVEFLRLRDVLREAARNPPAAQAAAQLRYDIFVSRVDLLGSGRLDHLMPAETDHRGVVRAIHAFVDSADRVFGPAPSTAFDAAAVAALLERMGALDAPLQTLVLGATHGMSRQIAERYDTVRDQGRVGVVLTVLLAATAAGFAFVALALLRRESLRRRALEKLTAELRHAQHEAESASQAKSAFLANMSHEIRTPFQGLLGMLQLIDREGLSAEQHHRLDTARRSAQHLLEVLDDVLDMSRLEAGTLELQPAPLDLRALVNDVHALMSAPAQAKGLRLTSQVAPSLPERVLADGTRLRQILFNLVSNAIKFTDRGTVDVVVRALGDGRLEIAVADTGIGIDLATRARMFQRFSQGDMSRARRHGGTGLGLEISRNLARLMGGDIGFDSTPGQGSRFYVTLPLQAASAPASAPVSAPAPSAVMRRLRVLAAEDNDVNREVLAAMIGMHEHDVSFAVNGREAVEAMRRERIDLVLMDLHMPEMDGLEATRAIRALDGAAAMVPIVALTADVFPDTRARCTDAGMNDFLTKPVGMAELAQLLARYASAPAAARA